LDIICHQKGPKTGTDKVKKGGSFMCHKVRVHPLFNSPLYDHIGL